MTGNDPIPGGDANPVLVEDVELRRLSPALGVEVCGVDLARPLHDSVFERIRDAWEQRCVLLFRRQRLTLIKQLQFASRFGKIGDAEGGPPAVLEVSNVRNVDGSQGILPEGPIDYHSDQSYTERPPIATMLYAMDIPERGGNTLFANGFRAYDALPIDVRDRLLARRALHLYDYQTYPTRRPTVRPPGAKQACHPLFRVHGPTGRRALYVSRLMTWSIVDMDADESRVTLDGLFRHQESPEFVYEHVWQPGDLVVWDNRSCIHGRTDFAPTEARRLRRVTMLEHRA